MCVRVHVYEGVFSCVRIDRSTDGLDRSIDR